ncbi:MAG: hypothetical protein HPY44_13515 [Armatimonadetes bacterium]|nr:hypothetical protein [Armatimonadota bacterium]
MTARSVLIAAGVLAVFVLGALWGQYGWMPSAQAQNDTPPAPPTLTELAGVSKPTNNPAVAVTPQSYITDNEEDPFNPDRIRRTRTKVQTVVVLYADGTVKTERVPGG